MRLADCCVTVRKTFQTAEKSEKKADARQKAMDKAATRHEASRARLKARTDEVARLKAAACLPTTGPTQAEVLEAKRVELGLKKYEFAEVLGMSRQRYSCFLAGRMPLYLAYIRRAFALGIPADVLLQGAA